MFSYQHLISGAPIGTSSHANSTLPAKVVPAVVLPYKLFGARRTCSVKTRASQGNANPGGLQVALKEWAVTCAALGQGDQTVILRKGGIREPTFTPAAESFFLFPTSFHSKANLLTSAANVKYQQELAFDQKTQVLLTIKYIASLSGCWTTHDPNVLSCLSEHHVWTEEFLESRLKWRAQQPITVLELQVAQLQEPLVIPSQDKYWGCFSWVDVQEGVSSKAVQSAKRVLPGSDFRQRQQEVRAALGTLADCREVKL